MKQVKCSEMGGPAECKLNLTGNTAEEVVMAGMKHVESEHPELAKQITAMTGAETEKWMSDFQKKFDELPNM
jgi:predicted small metal-binding protein